MEICIIELLADDNLPFILISFEAILKEKLFYIHGYIFIFGKCIIIIVL
jgi:hypothetical protein